MVICKFFLQGTCKFGNSCKYDHQINDSSNAHSVSIMRQNPPTNTGNVPDVNVLVKSVQTDMLNTEKGGQWLLSSYAPFKEKPAFPGFEDKSFEEVRLGFYEATKNGSVEQYKQQLQGFLQEAVIKIRTLQNPSQEIVTLLKQIYNTPLNQAIPFAQTFTKGSNFTGQGVFTSQSNNQVLGASLFSPANTNTNTSLFNPQTAATTPFNNQQTVTSPFNQQTVTSPFSTPVTNSPFNANNSPFAAVQQQANQGNSNLPFAQVMQSSSPFTQVQNPSLFTQAQSQTPSLSPFTQVQAQNPSPFTTQAHSSPFTQTPTQNVSPFAQVQNSQAPNPSPFVLPSLPPAQNMSPFASVMQNVNTTPFSSQAAPILTLQSNSPFASVAVQNAQSTQSNSVFASGQTTVVSVFGGQSAVGANKDSTLYSKESDLTKEELEAFRNETFQMGSIPEKPPPFELCF